jgi:diguanylate cyclase (GGDEF)-like protein
VAVAASSGDLDQRMRSIAPLLAAQIAFAFATHVLALRGGATLSVAVSIGLIADIALIGAVVGVGSVPSIAVGAPLLFLYTLHAIAAGILLSSSAGWRVIALSAISIAMINGLARERDWSTTFIATGTMCVLGGAATLFSAYNERELRRRNSELDSIREVTLGIEHSLSLTEICGTLCRGVASGFGFDAVAVLVIDGEQQLRCAGAHGITGSHRARVAVRGRVAEAMGASAPIVVARDDARRDGVLVDLIGPRGYVAVPIGDILLVATRSHRRRRAARVHQNEVEALERLGHHARLAIGNARLHEKVSKIAKTDALTEVANRGEFERLLDAEVGKLLRYRSFRQGIGMHPSVLLIDIDHFKTVNDRFGHQTGDEVLRRVAGILRDSVRTFDVVGRYGGEEFAVILPGTDIEAARSTAQRIRRAVAAEVVRTNEGKRVKITVSAGVATAPANGVTQEELLRAADGALYRAKEEGRNRVFHALDAPVGGAMVVSMDATRRRRERAGARARAAKQPARGRSSLPKPRTPRA